MGRFWKIGDIYVSGLPSVDKVVGHGVNSVLCVCKKQTDIEVYKAVKFWKYIPIPDGSVAKVDAIQEAVDWLKVQLQDGQTVLVHCLAGQTRSAMVAGLVIRDMHNLTGDEVLEILRRNRPRAVANKALEEYIRSLGRPRPEEVASASEFIEFLPVMNLAGEEE